MHSINIANSYKYKFGFPTLFLNILPKEIKDAIHEDPKLKGKGFRDLATWVRQHVLLGRQEALAEVPKRVLGRECGGGKIHALAPRGDEED